MIYNRSTGEITQEKVYENRAMRFLYSTTLGGLCVLILRLPIMSRIYGAFQETKRSKAKINAMIKNYEIDMNEYEECDSGDGTFLLTFDRKIKQKLTKTYRPHCHKENYNRRNAETYANKYSSFNDFIIRKRLHTNYCAEIDILIAPADSCALAYTIDENSMLSIKNRSYTLSRFLKDDSLAREYGGGIFLVFRLRVYDYHRFCFVDDGFVVSSKKVNGFLDSVNMDATGRFALSSNYREISLLRTSNFGNIVFAEVGAMLVGRIVQTHCGADFRKGDEKGYFEFGGSSIVMILKKGSARIDADIMAHSAKGIETKVNLGERIGMKRA